MSYHILDSRQFESISMMLSVMVKKLGDNAR